MLLELGKSSQLLIPIVDFSLIGDPKKETYNLNFIWTVQRETQTLLDHDTVWFLSAISPYWHVCFKMAWGIATMYFYDLTTSLDPQTSGMLIKTNSMTWFFSDNSIKNQ